ncbi:alpha-1,2-fucosyltransferase [Kiloniella sp.]|uniref:alpha-1,2-fucosyltransferase n=1 Tax=Kiloniella sp. TaxID=1938587 RepID=UPI003B0183BA
MSSQNQAVVVGLSGGLGNQIFQYAAGRALSLRLGAPLKLDTSWFAGQESRSFALSNFAVAGEICPHSPLPSHWLKSFESKISRRFGKSRMGAKIFREPHFHFCSIFEDLSTPVFLEGYWQSQRYFQSITTQIQDDLALVGRAPSSCQAMLETIRSSQSICMHIRRGDYVSSAITAKTHGTCSQDYYIKGINHLIEGMQAPHCFIFSDDPEWVRDNITLPCAKTVVDINSGEDAHWDLFLMSSCDHFLIANSSLSWWGAWLGRNKNKRVIAPRKWFLDSDKNTNDLIPQEWERI